jgi:GTP-binding protein
MTQTRFVLQKAIALNMRPIVVMNKVDRDSARCEQVDSELLELFMNLEATDEQMEYPIIYGLFYFVNCLASAKQGWAVRSLAHPRDSILPLLDLIIEHVPSPNVDTAAPFSMLVTVFIG